MKNLYSKLLIILVIALFLEIIVFNFTSYYTILGKYEVKDCKKPEFLYYNDDNTRAYVKFGNINTKVATIKIELSDNIDITEYDIYYSDATSKSYRKLPTKKYINSFEKSKYMPVYLSGNTNGLIISIDKAIYDDGDLENIVINEKIPFDFSIIRFICTLGILLFIYFMKNGKTFNSEYSPRNLKQEFILIGILAIFMVIVSFINTYSAIKTEGEIYSKDFVEAITNHQFELLKKPSEKFYALENPYDTLERDSLRRGIDYLWDTAFYNGAQYIYFGILPLLITFLPYYLITKNFLDLSIVVFAFSILIFLLFKEILLKILKRYFKEIPFKFIVYFLIIMCSGSLVLYANGVPRMYELVIVAGLYFVLQGIYFILKSLENENKKYLNIFWGSLFLALSVACRPTDLIASFLIVPYLIILLIKNIKNFKNSKMPLLKLILAVGIPYITVGISLMWYNYVRFGNIFEFGAKYQLTINNMTALGNRISTIPVGIITNLFSIPIFTAEFPFIANHNNIITYYGYYYIENMIGGLFILAPICFMSFAIFKANKKTENKELKIIVNSLMIVGLIIAIISVMIAGSNQRYLIDYAWMIILAGILIFMIIYNNFQSEEAKKIFQKILCIISIYTCIVGVSAGIVSEKSYMKEVSPEVYYKTRYTICFWE